MKFRNFFKILIAIILLFVVSGCEGDNTKYTLHQDGNFLVYTTDVETVTETSFLKGTQLIVRVREDKIEEGYTIDQVLVNGVPRETAYQYLITMDTHINLEVTFKEIPKGTARIGIIGHDLELTPNSPDNVYEIGTKVTVNAPQYYKFKNLIINGEVKIINETTYEFVVEQAIKIIVDDDSLEATHFKVNLVYPGKKPVTILQPQPDNYYLKGSKITLKAPNNYHFEGTILVVNNERAISGETITITVENHMTLVFSESNILLNSFNIILLNDNLSIIGYPDQTLYAHGTIVTIKSNSNHGLDVIKRLKVNGEWIEVNDVTTTVEVIDNLVIDAEFILYNGEYENIPISTTDFVTLEAKDTLLSPSLDVHLFIKNIDGTNKIVFQKSGNFKVRIDNGENIRYVELQVKYDLEDVSIYQNGFGFINRNEIIYVGNLNNFSIQLEGIALFPNLENPLETMRSTFVVNSNEVANLTYCLEKNGLDVTDDYLTVNEYGLKFSEEALNKEFNLIIHSEDGIEIIQPIKVIEGKNVYKIENLIFDSVMILQNNLTLSESIHISKPSKIIGNYHSIIFDSTDDNLIVVNNQYLDMETIMLKSRNSAEFMIFSNNSTVKLNNVVIENTRSGIYVTGGRLTSLNSKYQNMVNTNIMIESDADSFDPVVTNLQLDNNIFQKTNDASIIICDHILEQPQAKYQYLITNNKFNNTKEYVTLTTELNNDLLFLEWVDVSLVNRDLRQYNLAFVFVEFEPTEGDASPDESKSEESPSEDTQQEEKPTE